MGGLFAFVMAGGLCASALAQVAGVPSETQLSQMIEDAKARYSGDELDALVDRSLELSDAYKDEALAARDGLDGLDQIVGDLARDDFGFNVERYIEAQNKASGQTAARKTDARLYVFVSMGLPDSLLGQYLDDAYKFGARVVVRGLLDGSIQKSSKRLYEIMGQDETRAIGVQIDPRAFELFGVRDIVPAVALAASPVTRCKTPDCVIEVGAYDIIYGDVSVQYALERFAQDGDAKVAAKEIITRAGL